LVDIISEVAFLFTKVIYTTIILFIEVLMCANLVKRPKLKPFGVLAANNVVVSERRALY
jgi:hypothetical protein